MAYFEIAPLYLPFHKCEGIFLVYFLWQTGWAPEGNFHKILASPLQLGLLGEFNFQNFPHCSSNNSSLTAQVFLPRHWFSWRFALLNPISVKLWLFLQVCLLNTRCSGLLCNLPSYTEYIRIVGFLVCCALYLLDGVEAFRLLICRIETNKAVTFH